MKKTFLLMLLFCAATTHAQTPYVPTCLTPAQVATVTQSTAALAPILMFDETDAALRIADLNCANVKLASGLLADMAQVKTDIVALKAAVLVPGPSGPQGPPGANGATGPQGAMGPAGPAGPQGVPGPVGTTGAVGPQGPQGIQGVKGAIGPSGAVGPQGLQGIQGPAGPIGPQGPPGTGSGNGGMPSGVIHASARSFVAASGFTPTFFVNTCFPDGDIFPAAPGNSIDIPVSIPAPGSYVLMGCAASCATAPAVAPTLHLEYPIGTNLGSVPVSTGGCLNFHSTAPTAALTFSSAGTYVVRVMFDNAVVNFGDIEAAPVTAGHSVVLNWTPSTSVVAGYNIYRSPGPGIPPTKVNLIIVNAATYTDTSVASGKSYTYMARAVDSAGNESIDSNAVTAVVP